MNANFSFFADAQSNKATILKTTRSSNTNKSRQQSKTIEFISLKETIKVAQSNDTPILLAIVHSKSIDERSPKQMKSTTKTRVGVIHGMAEGEKRRMLKKSGLAEDTTRVKETVKDMVDKADSVVGKGELSRMLEEYKNVFLENLPYGPPLKKVIDHEIDVVVGSKPRHKSPYRRSNAEMEK